MKVIFLDVDGVLNSETFMIDNPNAMFKNILSESAIDLLRRIVDETGAKIVLSSSWRRIKMNMIHLTKQLFAHGISIHSSTPYSIELRNRGDEIGAWLREHPEVTNYVILDDDDDMGEHMSHLVQTTWKHGLEEKHVEEAVRLLSK